MKNLNLFALFFGFCSTLTLCMIFYTMFFNQNPNLLVTTNDYGEFWFEFFLLSFMLLIIIIAFIKEFKK